MEHTFEVDGKPITLIFVRPKREEFFQLEARKAEKRAAGYQPGHYEFGIMLIDFFAEHMFRKIDGKFPTRKESIEVDEFCKENGIDEISKEYQLKFLEQYYFQNIIVLMSENVGPSKDMIKSIIDEREATKNSSSGSVSISTDSTVQLERTESVTSVSIPTATSTLQVPEIEKSVPINVK